MAKKCPSTKTWILVHVIFPMLPFIIEGFVRLLILGISLETFSYSTLAASTGLLCLFINQNLLAHTIPLSNDDDHYEQDLLVKIATTFLFLGIISFVLFTIIVLLTALIPESNIPKNRLYLVEFATVVCTIISIKQAYMAQQSFKLRALI